MRVTIAGVLLRERKLRTNDLGLPSGAGLH
jgi:hypothetical protein